jgi:hypothetical protein
MVMSLPRTLRRSLIGIKQLFAIELDGTVRMFRRGIRQELPEWSADTDLPD